MYPYALYMSTHASNVFTQDPFWLQLTGAFHFDNAGYFELCMSDCRKLFRQTNQSCKIPKKPVVNRIGAKCQYIGTYCTYTL